MLVEESEIKGTEETQQLNDRLKDGVYEILKQRKYRIIEKTESKVMKLSAGSESLGNYIVAENDENKTILVLLPSEEVVRVATVREFKNQMEELDINEGMLIPLKRFTYTAEREAKAFKITALRKNHPVFNIFSHSLVPEHHILNSDTEIDEVLDKYNAKLKQLPKIYEDDPAVVAINAAIGDVIKIVRSPDSYLFRLVIPRVDTGVTEGTAMVQMITKRKLR